MSRRIYFDKPIFDIPRIPENEDLFASVLDEESGQNPLIINIEDVPDDLSELPEDAEIVWKHDDDEFSDDSIWDNMEE